MGLLYKKRPTTTKGRRNGGRKKKWMGVMALSSLLCTAAALGGLFGGSFSKTDPGASITRYKNLSREEIQDELDRAVEESMMTVSVAPTVTMSDEKLSVNVINDEGNRFAQRFEVIQNGSVLYESGRIDPGQTVETCNAPGAETGEAYIQIQAVDLKSGVDHGNPTRVKVSITEA